MWIRSYLGHIQGFYSDTVLDGLNVLGLGSFIGNIWAGQAKDAVFGFFFWWESQWTTAAGSAVDICHDNLSEKRKRQ